MSEEHIRLARDGAVMTVTFDNPARRNALGTNALDQLEALAEEIAAGDVRAVILTGAGDRAFTAGFNLAELGESTPDSLLNSRFGDVFEVWARLPVPVIGALNGPCMGGGVHVASACDVLLAVPSVRFMIPASRFGFVYQAGPVARIMAAFGQARAAQLLYLNQELTVQDILPRGLVAEVCAPGDLMTRARAWADRVVGLAPLAVAGVKEIVREAPTAERADEIARRAAYSEDVQEGLAAIREKRTPIFHGR
ncbi:MAG: enoyl-CoA hydratase-related protein [Pseudomonadota bacterium]